MANFLQSCLLFVTLRVAAAGTWCSRGNNPFSPGRYCDWGCCFGEKNGCCFPTHVPFYRHVRIIVPVSVAAVLVLFGIIALVTVCVRRRRPTRTIQYNAPFPQPQVLPAAAAENPCSSQASLYPPEYRPQASKY